MKLVKRNAILVDLDCVINAPLVRSTQRSLGVHLDRLWAVLAKYPETHFEIIESYTSQYVDREHRLIWAIMHAEPDDHFFEEAEHPERLHKAIRYLRTRFDASFVREDFSEFARKYSSEGHFVVAYSADTYSEETNHFLACAGLEESVRAIKAPGSSNRHWLEDLMGDLEIDANRSVLIAHGDSQFVEQAKTLGFRLFFLKSQSREESGETRDSPLIDDYSQVDLL